MLEGGALVRGDSVGSSFSPISQGAHCLNGCNCQSLITPDSH